MSNEWMKGLAERLGQLRVEEIETYYLIARGEHFEWGEIPAGLVIARLKVDCGQPTELELAASHSVIEDAIVGSLHQQETKPKVRVVDLVPHRAFGYEDK